ncbi:MAG: hypothetical protein MZV63_25280 [Marinilabiliales bacterium]|nr:hypothetical protein [Marinilabiliales bacterium]
MVLGASQILTRARQGDGHPALADDAGLVLRLASGRRSHPSRTGKP